MDIWVYTAAQRFKSYFSLVVARLTPLTYLRLRRHAMACQHKDWVRHGPPGPIAFRVGSGACRVKDGRQAARRLTRFTANGKAQLERGGCANAPLCPYSQQAPCAESTCANPGCLSEFAQEGLSQHADSKR